MVKLPHEVREAGVIGFPALKFEVAVAYDPFEGRYSLVAPDDEDDDMCIEIGSFPEDVAHILLDPLAGF